MRVVVALCVAAGASSASSRGAEAGGSRAPEVSCHACIVVDDTDRLLFARRADARLPNASTTKMVTAILVLRDSALIDEVTVSRRAAATGGGGLDLVAGDRFSVRELLLALLLTSSNDAAVALAEHAAGSEAAFVDAMNAYAHQVDATETTFTTPHGLDDPGHLSSAGDLALFAWELLERPLLARIVATKEARISGPRGALPLENRNDLLGTYRGAIGVKTGFTAAAGNVLVSAAERQGRRVVAVVMRSEDASADSRALLDHGFARLQRTILLGDTTPVGAIIFDPAGATGAVAGGRVRGMANPADLDVRFAGEPAAHPPLTAGETIGWVTLLAGEEVVETVPAVTARSVERAPQPWLGDVLAQLLRWAAVAIGKA